MSEIHYREATEQDADILWKFLAVAAYEPDPARARQVPIVAAHLEGWMRLGDFGVVAERGGRPIGATWARQFDLTEEPTFYVGPTTPELSIGVLAEERGNGVGLALLERLALFARRMARDGLCLNVRDSNPAIRLYERAGYRLIKGSEVRNRVGGFSIGMLLDLTGAQES